MRVDLSLADYHAATQVGLLRFTVSELARLNNASTYPRGYYERLEQEITGACGELAFCKATGLFWPASVNTFHSVADAGLAVEVRSTRLANGALIVRDNDDDKRWYYLVTGEPPSMTIHGCILGAKAKRDEFLRNPHGHRPSWFVPQDQLTPIRSRDTKGGPSQ